MASIKQEVDAKELRQQDHWVNKELRRIPLLFLGVIIYCIGVNLFLRPLHLYSGGFMGVSQLIDTLLHNLPGFKLKLDLAGIIYYLLNIPFLLIALRVMPRRFVAKTILTVTLMTLILTVIPIPEEPILEEKIANCLVAGILSGIGIGFVLRTGACDGGMSIVGMLLIQKRGGLSVGRINATANLFLYGIYLFLFDVPTVIYSLIYSVINSAASDKVHTQNINVQALIVTKLEDVRPLEIEIMGSLARGLTRWQANGSYTQDAETVFMAVISKYEIPQLKAIVHNFDPHAFVMIDEGITIDGHFIRKLT